MSEVCREELNEVKESAQLPALVRHWDVAYKVMTHQNNSQLCGISRTLDGRYIALASTASNVIVLDTHDHLKVVAQHGTPGWWTSVPVTVTLESLLIGSALQGGHVASGPTGVVNESGGSGVVAALSPARETSLLSEPSSPPPPPSSLSQDALAAVTQLRADLALLEREQQHLSRSLSLLDTHLQLGLAHLTAADLALWLEDLDLVRIRPQVLRRGLAGPDLLTATASSLSDGTALWAAQGSHAAGSNGATVDSIPYGDAAALLLAAHVVHHGHAAPPDALLPAHVGMLAWRADAVARWVARAGAPWSDDIINGTELATWTGAALCSADARRVRRAAGGRVSDADAEALVRRVAEMRAAEAEAGIAQGWTATWTAEEPIVGADGGEARPPEPIEFI